MRTLKSAFDFILGKRSQIKENIGGSGMCLIDKMPAITSRKARTFFHHSIICCVTDAFEYFFNMDTANNLFYNNIDKVTGDSGERFIKWETVYHTLFFTNEIRGSEEVADFESSLFSVFNFSADEKEGYYKFKELLTENESEFITSFSTAAVKDIFGIEEMDGTDASFIYNFYYNCYTDFYKTYSKYSYVAAPPPAAPVAAVTAEGGVYLEAGSTSG